MSKYVSSKAQVCRDLSLKCNLIGLSSLSEKQNQNQNAVFIMLNDVMMDRYRIFFNLFMFVFSFVLQFIINNRCTKVVQCLKCVYS